MNAPLPPPISEESPIRRPVEKPCPPPGIYLMALRERANNGQKWVADRVLTLKKGLMGQNPFAEKAPDEGPETQVSS